MTNTTATPRKAPEPTDATESAEATASPGHGEGDVATDAASQMTKKRKGMIAGLLIALVILALLFVWYLMNRKPLSELPGLGSTNLPHYELSIYGASKPLGVAVTPTGDRIYVTESDGTRVVRVYDRTGKQTGTLKPPSSTGGPAVHLPMYVAINPKTQDVYVSDRMTAAIYIYDAKGTFLRTFAPKGVPGGKWAPLALAFGPDGSLYATDIKGPTTKHRAVVFGPDGTLVHSMGTPGLSFPNGIVVDAHGNIEVSDSNNSRLVVFNIAGQTVSMITAGVGEGDLGMPRGAAVDDSGRLYVVDTSDHNVKVYDIDNSKSKTPAYVGLFGNEGQLDGTFEFPNGIATDTRAHIYITDRENNRVQVWGY